MKLKRYEVRLVFHQTERIEVEAHDEAEAKKLALAEVSVGYNAELFDSEVDEVKP